MFEINLILFFLSAVVSKSVYS